MSWRDEKTMSMCVVSEKMSSHCLIFYCSLCLVVLSDAILILSPCTTGKEPDDPKVRNHTKKPLGYFVILSMSFHMSWGFMVSGWNFNFEIVSGLIKPVGKLQKCHKIEA